MKNVLSNDYMIFNWRLLNLFLEQDVSKYQMFTHVMNRYVYYTFFFRIFSLLYVNTSTAKTLDWMIIYVVPYY